MLMKRRLASVLFAVFAFGVFAADSDENRLVNEAVINGSVDEVWAAFTTKKGLESWMVGLAEIDLKVGGKMLTRYDPNGKLGDSKTIENTILSYDPKRMFSIKATKPPEGFPFPHAICDMWSVVYFEKISPTQTKVTVIGLGYGSDAESKRLKEFFRRGNEWTVKKLQEHFAKTAK